MKSSVSEYFARADNRPPPGVQAMQVRNRAMRTLGPYEIVLESSCGLSTRQVNGRPEPYVRVAGSARLFLYDVRASDDKPIAVKRWQVDNWREALDEMRVLEKLLAKEA